jgi:predicted dithiol-disulfide oxidoreductase (DUF899 family)
MAHQALTPAAELAAKAKRSFLNDSAEYRTARVALLAEEIELRRHVERVAEQRRALPAGGEVTQDYDFTAEDGRTVRLSEMFGEHETLFVYNYMFGPERERPCPMCTTLLDAWDGMARHLQQRAALAIVARSPADRLTAFKRERGWRFLPFYSSATNSFNRDYAFETPGKGENPALNVFTRKDGTILHSWGDEMGPQTADPGQDPRGAIDASLLWSLLDLTPGGRGTDWYPKLDDASPMGLRGG